QDFQAANGRFEHALAALAVDILFEVAGKRSDDLDPLAREEFGEVLLAGDFEHGEIAAIHHAHTHGARRAHQSAEVRVEFRRAAGDVEGTQAPSRKESEHRVDHLARHFLAAVWAGTDVAVHAGLVAAIADIDLERVEAAALNRRKGNLLKPRPGIAHRARSIFATQIRIACGARHVDWHGPRTKSREDIWRRRSAKRVGVPCAWHRSRDASERSIRARRRRDRGSVFDADTAEARKLHGGMA